MRLSIFSYPKLRQKSVLSELLSPCGIERYRSFLDSRRSVDENVGFYLVSSGDSFVLIVLSSAVHDKAQIVLEIFGPDDFEKIGDIPERSDCSTEKPEPPLRRALSFALYIAFYIQRAESVCTVLGKNNENKDKTLINAGFVFDGTISRYFRNGSEFSFGKFFSITKREFYERSTGLVKFYENFLVVRASEDAVFSLDVLRCDSLKKNKDLDEHLDVLPDNIFDIVMKDKLYLPPVHYETLSDTVMQLCEYISGTRKVFELETETQAATEFQKAVWEAASLIPYGQTVSYDHIAYMISEYKDRHQPGILSRAVGSALSKNPVMIIIPCHRVIGKDGKLRGFAGGIDVKDQLLNHELTNFSRQRR